MIDICLDNVENYGIPIQAVVQTEQKTYNAVLPSLFHIEQYNNPYTYNKSNFDIVHSILSLFQDKPNAYERLKDIFSDDDIKNEQIKLNISSFYSLFSWINNREVDFDYSIGVTDDGFASIQHNSATKYIYIKFYKDIDVFYNLYAKNSCLFDLIRTATLSDFYGDYQRLCSIIG